MELLEYLKKELNELSNVYTDDAKAYSQQGEENSAKIQYEIGILLYLFVNILTRYKSQKENHPSLNPVD